LLRAALSVDQYKRLFPVGVWPCYEPEIEVWMGSEVFSNRLAVRPTAFSGI
jgi:hypothetical protein